MARYTPHKRMRSDVVQEHFLLCNELFKSHSRSISGDMINVEKSQLKDTRNKYW